MKTFNIKELFARYIFLFLIGLGNLYVFYLIFTPLTIYPVYYFLKLFYPVSLSIATLYFPNKIIEIIPACVAGAAYYLLLILNLTTSMPLKKRLYSVFYSFSMLLILNILRIILLSILFINSFQFFDITHKIFWYGISTIFVVAIWFSEVKIFKIKNIPIYSDIIKFKKYIKN